MTYRQWLVFVQANGVSHSTGNNEFRDILKVGRIREHARGPRTCYVAANGGTFVAFAAGHLTSRYACDGELQWINVIPESRGIGVAFSCSIHGELVH